MSSAMSLLTVMFGDEEIRSSGREVSFGRSSEARLKLDRAEADRSLSRFAGAISLVGQQWLITNTSSRSRLDVEVDGGVRAVLEPGAAPLPLPSPSVAEVRVRTARDYVLDVIVAGDQLPLRLPEADGGTTTASVADHLDLTDRERLVLAALAEPRLTDPSAEAWTIPSVDVLRDRLRLRDKQIERTIDAIAVKMHPYVGDLIGSNRGRSNTRRFQMVDFAIRTGCVSSTDLRLIDQLDHP